MSIKICVEGGGGGGGQARVSTLCRRGFSEYFAKLVGTGKKPRIVACGDRRSTYDDFCTSLKMEKDKYDLILLLVDAEEAVAAGHTAWQHLKNRKEDGWDRPEGAKTDSAHLMVQCMEAWFLADKDAISSYFGNGFLRNSLPAQPNVELISKGDTLKGLEHATRPTKKKRYNKTEHGYDLLGLISPMRVGQASVHAKALNDLVAANAV